MFYSKFMFVKKGPLSKVWIAAHFHRKLNKTHVLGTDINISVKSILDPTTPLALRLSGQLLLGLVRIYQRKVKYLQEDCSDALTKMKMIFRPGVVDLPAENGTASTAQITHADNAIDIDYVIPEIPLDDLDTILDPNMMNSQENDFSIAPSMEYDHEADKADITLKDGGLMNFDDNILAGFDDDLVLAPFDDELQNDSGKISDVELPRYEEQQDDYNIDNAMDPSEPLEAFNKSTDQSFMGQEFSNLDNSTTDADNQSIASEKVQQTKQKESLKPKPIKKRKLEKEDANTEISGKQIGAQLKDTSDIVITREFVPFAKRSKFRQNRINVSLQALLQQPCSLNVSFLAPALLEAYHRIESTEAVVPTEEKKTKKRGREEVPAPEPAPEVVEEQADFEFQQDDNFDFGGDVSTSVANDSFAAGTPGKDSVAAEEVEEESEEKHTQDIVTQKSQRSELDDDVADFFGEKKSSQKASQGTEEEEELFGWSSRTKKMHQNLANHMKNKKSVQFDKVVEGKARNTAAGVFYQLLVLKSHSIIDVEQKQAYSDITILKDKNFASARAH